MKKFFMLIAMISALGIALVPAERQAKADDFIDLDLSGVAPNVRNVFRRAEAFWESRITGYSNTLPIEVRSQLTGRLAISAQTVAIDGPGGILGQAGPTATADYFEAVTDPISGVGFMNYSVPISGIMQFDVFDAAVPGFDEVVRHEMAHVLGIGSLWQANGFTDDNPILGTAPTDRLGLLQRKRTDQFHYVGKHGLAGFRRQSGHFRANYVPVENRFPGAAGTNLGHWAGDNWFFNPRRGNKSELMIGFLGSRPKFVSEATWGSLADMGWAVQGFNAGDGTFVGQPGSPLFPKSGFNTQPFSIVAVPEPSSAAMICLGLAGMLVRRRRS